MKDILLIGGARSGKSRFAQELALRFGKPVLFVATAEAGDEEMRQRIEEHRKARPPHWRTLETTRHVGSQIAKTIGEAQVVIIDCITLLVNNVFRQYIDETAEHIDAPLVEQEVSIEIAELIQCLNHFEARFIVVTNEIGMGLVPDNPMGRLYRDLLGKTNHLLAEQASEVYLMVAGLPVQIKPAILADEEIV